MLDGNVLLRQERDEVPEGTLSCPYRTLADYHCYRHYEGLRLLPSACDEIIIQQTLIIFLNFIRACSRSEMKSSFHFTRLIATLPFLIIIPLCPT